MSEVSEKTKPQKANSNKTRKLRRPGQCSCDSPTPKSASMKKVNGGTINYIHCDVCMEVLDWCDEGERSLSPEDYAKTGVATSQATPEPSLPPTMADRFAARDTHPAPSSDDSGGDPVELAGRGIAGANMPTGTPEPEPEPKTEAAAATKTASFPVTQIAPVIGKSNEMTFVCQNNGRFFVVNVPSTEKKVARALADQSVIVGKRVVLEFTDTDPSGNPVNAKALRVEK